MNKYVTVITGSEAKNNIEITGENSALFNDAEVSFDHTFITPNVILVRINDKNFFFTIGYNEDTGETEIDYDSKLYTLTCKSELDLIKEKLSLGKGGGKQKKDIKSPMPGIIKSINVTKDQQVKKGEIILVLEAMKMENEIKAVADCVVKKVNVEVMESVEKNELLVELE